jgi:hypothetical protein
VSPQYGPGLLLNATATSGLPVTFTASPANYCQILNATSGSYVQLANNLGSLMGSCTIVASQAVSSYYNPASSVSQVVSWSPDITVINVQAPTSITVNGTSTVLASYTTKDPSLSSGIAALNTLVVNASTSPAVCTVVSSTQVTTSGGMPTQTLVKGLKSGVC